VGPGRLWLRRACAQGVRERPLQVGGACAGIRQERLQVVIAQVELVGVVLVKAAGGVEPRI
jgi:hypothetical protein